MKARSREVFKGIENIDLQAQIAPESGAGGITFKNTISDFEYILAQQKFDKDYKSNLQYSLDEEWFYLTIKTLNDEFTVEIDLFSGQITSITCKAGYTGKLLNGFGIGSSMNEFIKADNNIGFDLDNHFFCRFPFDGLIIYPPDWDFADRIYTAVVSREPSPDFKIETIEIVSLDFAKKHLDNLYFED